MPSETHMDREWPRGKKANVYITYQQQVLKNYCIFMDLTRIYNKTTFCKNEWLIYLCVCVRAPACLPACYCLDHLRNGCFGHSCNGCKKKSKMIFTKWNGRLLNELLHISKPYFWQYTVNVIKNIHVIFHPVWAENKGDIIPLSKKHVLGKTEKHDKIMAKNISYHLILLAKTSKCFRTVLHVIDHI